MRWMLQRRGLLRPRPTPDDLLRLERQVGLQHRGQSGRLLGETLDGECGAGRPL